MTLGLLQLPHPGPPSARLGSLPPGDAGTRAVLKEMARLARRFSKDLAIIQLARKIVQHVPPKQYGGEVVAVHAWVRANIRYVRDVEGVETLADPIATINMHAGDCDDQAVVVATLLLAIGHKCRYVAIGPAPGALCHVFTDTLVGNQWVAVETTENWPVGRRPDPRRYPAVMLENI